jgi:hypothetical protein
MAAASTFCINTRTNKNENMINMLHFPHSTTVYICLSYIIDSVYGTLLFIFGFIVFSDVNMNGCHMKCKVRIGLNLYRSS